MAVMGAYGDNRVYIYHQRLDILLSTSRQLKLTSRRGSFRQSCRLRPDLLDLLLDVETALVASQDASARLKGLRTSR